MKPISEIGPSRELELDHLEINKKNLENMLLVAVGKKKEQVGNNYCITAIISIMYYSLLARSLGEFFILLLEMSSK